MKLQLSHITPYLPWELYVKKEGCNPTILDHDCCSWALDREYKPILRPLSDLTKEIEINGVKFIPIVRLYNTSRERDEDREIDFEFIKTWSGNFILRHKSSDNYYTDFVYSQYSFYNSTVNIKEKKKWNDEIKNQYFLFEMLFKWHFDVFGLIDKKLAIDINTVEKLIK